MSAVDTRPVPCNILRWPKIKDLITQQKFIYVALYFNGDTTACGCYLLGVVSLAADLSMTPASLDDALLEFKRRGLIEYDKDTGELFVVDWPRWHRYSTPAALGALKTSIEKVQSRRLGITVKNAYESTLHHWKGKGKDKIKAKVSSHEEEGAALSPPSSKPRLSRSGVLLWTPEDAQDALLIEDRFPIEDIKSAVGQLKEQGKEPLPSRVNKLLSVPADTQFLPDQWWETEASTMIAAKRLGLVARPGELMPEFRQRIRAEAHQRQQKAHRPEDNNDKHLGALPQAPPSALGRQGAGLKNLTPSLP